MDQLKGLVPILGLDMGHIQKPDPLSTLELGAIREPNPTAILELDLVPNLKLEPIPVLEQDLVA